MGIRYFTVEEANALLPELEPLVAQLLERRARVSTVARDLQDVLSDMRSNVGNYETSALTNEFAQIESLVERIQAHGCVVKSLESGLVDFLCDRDGRDVYLCWRYGEPRVSYYHDLHTGFNGRRPID
jgi:hypothetical protein